MKTSIKYLCLVLVAVVLVACSSKSDKLAELAKQTKEQMGCPKMLVPDVMFMKDVTSDENSIIFDAVITNDIVAKALIDGDKESMKQGGIASVKSNKDVLTAMEEGGFSAKFRYLDEEGNVLHVFEITPEDIKNSDDMTTEQFIDIQVANTKTQLPVRIDEITVATKVYRDGTTMVYVYDCDTDLIEAGVTEKIMKEILLPGLGTMKSTYKRMGVSLRYIYCFEGEEQVIVNITPEEM